MIAKDVKLVDVIQVMLVHRILPCQRRSRPLWEFNPKKHQTLERLFGTTHEGAWKLLFKGNEKPPATVLDRGHDCKHPPSEVCYFRRIPYLFVSRVVSELLQLLLRDWMERAKQIQCPAPLPEEPVIPRLAKMLVPAPYKAPENKAKKKAMGTRKSLRRNMVLDSSSKNTEEHSSNDNEEEEEENPLPQNKGEKKRKATPSGEAEGSKKGRTLPPDHSTTAAYSEEEWLPRGKPLARS